VRAAGGETAQFHHLTKEMDEMMRGPYQVILELLSPFWLPLAMASAAAGADEAPPPMWLFEITRVAYTDLPNTQKIQDWPEKVISDFAEAGVQMMFSRAHSGESWQGLGWKSRYGELDPALRRTPAANARSEGLSPDRDGTREVTQLCHRRGIRYVPYYWAQREAQALGQMHPDWRCRNSAGKPTAYYCVNTPYRDLVRNRIVELVKDIGADGVFFDMFNARKDECYCDACREKFRALAGQDPPVKEDFDSLVWQQWANFKYRTIEEALLDFNRAIKAANPEAALLINTWNAWVYGSVHNARNSIRVVECVDGLLEETGWYDVVDPSFFAFPAQHNFMNWHLAGLCGGKRAFMWGAPELPGWAPVGPLEARIRVATMMTNGAVPAHSVPGRDTLRTYMADIALREPYIRNARLAPWCGLVMSE
jgi:hypothetical protein